MSLKLPRLLGADMEERARLHPLRLTLALRVFGLSGAEMTLPPGEALQAGDWVRLYDPAGGCAVYRVERVRRDAVTGVTVAGLLHGLTALADADWPEEETVSGPAREQMERLLAKQACTDDAGRPLWRLGDCALAEPLTVAPGGTLLSALQAALAEYPECLIETDQSALPWALHLRRADETPTCEARLARNLEGAALAWDASQLCTEVIAEALPGGRLRGEGAEASGIVSRWIDFPEGTSEQEALRLARRFLKNRQEAALTASLSALALAKRTGEALDAFAPGAVLRLALAGKTLTVRIAEMVWEDAVLAPERVQITLANQAAALRLRQTASEERIEKAERAGRLAAIKARQNAKALTLKAERTEVTALGTRVSQAEVSLAEAKVSLSARQQEITALTEHLGAAGIDVNGALSQVKLVAYSEDMDRLEGRLRRAEASITVNADAIELKVDADGVISCINQSAEAILIRAERIDLDGYVTASQLSATNARLQNLLSGQATADTLRATNVYVGQTGGGSLVWHGQAIRTYAVKDTGGTTRQVLGYTLS